jgi:hypothetical protein
MRQYIYIFICLFFIISCNNRQNNNKKNTTLTDTLSIDKSLEYIDSLDTDTSNYITEFPQNVENVLHLTSDSLWEVVKKSTKRNDKKQDVLLTDTLSKMLRYKGFHIGTSIKKTIADKKYFNKRELISWCNTKPDTITAQIIYWDLGHKYILIEQRLSE